MQNANPPTDSLLSCLVFLTAHHGKARSADALVAGLPYDARGMSAELFIEAAHRIGLRAQKVERRGLSDIPKQVLPCVVMLKDGSACVLLSHENKAVVTWLPATQKKHEATPDEFAKSYAGVALLVKPQPFFIDRELLDTSNPALHWFWGAVRENKEAYIRVGVASLLINIFALASPVYIMNVYDRVIPNAATETGWALAIGVLIVFTVDFIMRTLRGYFVDYAGRRIDVQVTRRVFDQVLRHGIANRPASSGASLNMLRDFDSIRDFLTSATMTGLIDLPFGIMFVLVIFFLGGQLGLAVLFLMALALALSLILQVPLKKSCASRCRRRKPSMGCWSRRFMALRQSRPSVRMAGCAPVTPSMSPRMRWRGRTRAFIRALA